MLRSIFPKKRNKRRKLSTVINSPTGRALYNNKKIGFLIAKSSPTPGNRNCSNKMPLCCCSTLQLINKGILPPSEQQIPLSDFHTSVIFRQRLKRDRDSVWVYRRTNGRAIRVLAIANPNASSTGRRSARKEIIMVDPLEAKRLAAKQMEQIKANERLKRRLQIEAINGAWAMIGLTAGLVIEGETGKGILSQLAGYWAAIIGLLSINGLLNNVQSIFGNSP